MLGFFPVKSFGGIHSQQFCSIRAIGAYPNIPELDNGVGLGGRQMQGKAKIP
jgi:hypothetical protein